MTKAFLALFLLAGAVSASAQPVVPPAVGPAPQAQPAEDEGLTGEVTDESAWQDLGIAIPSFATNANQPTPANAQGTGALALELSPENIRVNAVCPGTVDTPIVSQVAEIFPTDLDPRVADRLMMMLPGKAISPAEIGSAIVYLASPAARMITGAVLAFDGGM